MNLNKYQNIYFIGIGGIGMSALARYFKSRELSVAGYDKTPTALTDALQREGIPVNFTDTVGYIPQRFKNIENALIVYTPAIPADNEQLLYFKNNHFDLYKRAEILAAIANTGKGIAVGGTHGKTTTSSLIAHIFNQKKTVASAFLGGIARNGDTNFVAGTGDVVVLEADEFDRSFHHLHPHIALITSMDADHLDIYGNEENIRQAFVQFAQSIRPGGKTIHRYGLNLSGISYGIDAAAAYSARNIRIENGKYFFELHTPQGHAAELSCGLPGRHNVENAAGAAAACLEFGLTMEQVATGIETFKGVARRFDVQVNTPETVYIDDYAHHPAEIKALIHSVREMYPGKSITAIFQPHLYSRTKDFADGFAESLSAADEIWLMDIYPAREKPIPGITSEWLLKKINTDHKRLMNQAEILNALGRQKPEILLTVGAGDIDRLVDPIKKLLS